MKAQFLAAFLICLLVAVHAWTQESSYAPKQLVVSFENKDDEVLSSSGGQTTCMFPSVMQILTSYNMTGMRRLYSGDKGAKNIYLIELNNDEDVEPAIQELTEDPAIRSAIRNYGIEFLAEPTDWYFSHDFWEPGDPDTTEDQWYLKVMQADKAWDVQRGSPEITIGIMDTGIDKLANNGIILKLSVDDLATFSDLKYRFDQEKVLLRVFYSYEYK